MESLIKFIDAKFFFAMVVVVSLSEFTKSSLSVLENYLETKYQREIKFFNHCKIIISIFWTMVVVATFVLAKLYTWNEYPLYCLAIIGLSTVAYELILKRVRSLFDK